MSTGSSWPSILTDMVKRSFNLPYQTLSGLSTNRSTPGGRVKTKSSRLYQWYVMLGKGQHWRRWCPSCVVWPICNVPNMLMCPSPCIEARIWRFQYSLVRIITYYYIFQQINITMRVAASAWCPPAAAWRVRPNDYDLKAAEAVQG